MAVAGQRVPRRRLSTVCTRRGGSCSVRGRARGPGVPYKPAPETNLQLFTCSADTTALLSDTFRPDFRTGDYSAKCVGGWGQLEELDRTQGFNFRGRTQVFLSATW